MTDRDPSGETGPSLPEPAGPDAGPDADADADADPDAGGDDEYESL